MSLGTAVLLGLAAGCATAISPRCGDAHDRSAEVDFGDFASVPRARLGSLPFPGPFTLYARADASNLGSHSYSGRATGDEPETTRGIIYTCRAGFLDVSHVRITADLVGYIHARVDHALRNQWPCVRFRAHEPSVYSVRFSYPPEWAALDPARRERVIEEASIRVAQRLAFTVMTWHELLTWYGYKSTVVIPEHDSAFTYEDSISHAVGMLAGGEALRSDRPFDEALTIALDRAIGDLEPVGPDELDIAVDAVRGTWWDGGAPIKRNVDAGFEALEPWLAPNLPFCPDPTPARFELPTLADVEGMDLSGLYAVLIEPNVLETGTICARLDPPAEAINPARDFPTLLADIRDSVGVENTTPDAVTRQTMR